MLTFGQVKQWRPGPLDTSGEGLRRVVQRLESSREDVEGTAVPDSWQGLARVVAVARRDALVRSMDDRISGTRTLMRGLLAAESSVTALRRSVESLEGEAGAKDFRIGDDGTVTDTSQPPTFASSWEAQEWTDGRRSTARGLADEAGRLVDRAVEIDSALVDAIDHRDDEQELRGVPDPEVAQAWGEMSDAERRAVLEQIVEEELADLDLDPPPTVTFVDPDESDDEFYDDWADANGLWSAGRNEIWFNPDRLDDPYRLHTAAHEARHARQSDAVDDLGRNPWEWLTGQDPFEQHEDSGISRDEAESWQDNWEDDESYIQDGDPKPGGGTYDYDDYTGQPVEEDAFGRGREFLDGLTPEELERLREEVR